MNNEITEENMKTTDLNKNPWDNIGGDYVKLETDKAKLLMLMNWKIQRIKKFKDEKESEKQKTEVLKEQDEFSADVISEDGKPAKKVFSTTSVGCLRGLKEIFSKYWPDTKTPRLIRIKKIGEGFKTVYDVEEQTLKKI